MTYIHINAEQTLQAIRRREWNFLSDGVIQLAEQCVKSNQSHQTTYKAPYQSRERNRQRELLQKSLLLGLQPLSTIFQLNQVEGCTHMLARLGQNKIIQKVDSSQLVMHLLKVDPDALAWGLRMGWDYHFSLLATRQVDLDWPELKKGMSDWGGHSDVLDAWIRKWVKRNPSLLEHLSQPTYVEATQFLETAFHLPMPILKCLQTNTDVATYINALRSLGEWDDALPNMKKLPLLQTYFREQQQVAMPTVDAGLFSTMDV